MLHTTSQSLSDGYSEYSISPDDINEDKAYIYNGSESCPIYTDHHAIPRSN